MLSVCMYRSMYIYIYIYISELISIPEGVTVPEMLDVLHTASSSTRHSGCTSVS